MRKKFRIIFFLSLLFNFLFFWNSFIISAQDEEEVKLIVGESKIFPTRTPTRVAIGNPKVADIADVTNKEISVSAKSAGMTTLVYWDGLGEQSIKIRVVPEDIEDIKHRVDNLLVKLSLPEVYTKTADEEGKVLLLGRVKTLQERDRIMTALGLLKDKTTDLIQVKEEEAVIEIDVQILELDKDGSSILGFTWPDSATVTEVGSPGIPNVGAVSVITGTTPSTSSTVTTTGTRLGSLFRVLNYSRNAFTWRVDALVEEGKARILSRPRLACQSGKEAELMVGGEKPIFSTTLAATTGASGTQVEYKDYGIKLNIKPTVTEGERIKLGLRVEVSEIGQAETIGSTTTITALAYPLTKRTAATELFLNDGQTLAIGGLIKQKTDEELRKFPWLADIPVLGAFFRRRTIREGGGSGERGSTELFITLTPQIVSREEDIAKAKKETETKTRTRIITSSLFETGSSTPLSRYASIVQKRVLDNLEYPVLAKATGFEGTVKLSLHLSYRGELLDAVVKNSSGHKALDDDAVNTAKGIASYPPFPSSIDASELWIDIPIVYRLN
ncbi:MAG: TonB family protein [Candidatus Omnitrophica bacterium]|nr:TonB family protein [Candidatus Omnitrophota bacterium]MDD5238491.1 TonB family protein [Candidatus Omnitrophota bacterium]